MIESIKTPSGLISRGDRVHTNTHGVYQNTQKSLSRKWGKVLYIKDEYMIGVKLEKERNMGTIEFSAFELSHKKPEIYNNERT